tara:strand:+ start:32693 stop:33412 length:720 start_codon:yes stop_codon:yes gene_type:complete
MSKNNQIIILCGGKGSRLGKITKNLPKPLVEIANKSILEHKIDYYKTQGYNKYIFCTGYKGDVIKDRFFEKLPESKYSNIGENAGILERIHAVKEYFQEPAIVSYGDTYAEIDFDDLLKKHNESNALLTLVIAKIQNPFGLINADKYDMVLSFEEKPLLNHYIGYSVISPLIFNKIPDSIITLPDGHGIIKMINYLSQKKLVMAYNFDGLQVTVNNSEELKKANEAIGKYYTIKEKNEK